MSIALPNRSRRPKRARADAPAVVHTRGDGETAPKFLSRYVRSGWLSRFIVIIAVIAAVGPATTLRAGDAGTDLRAGFRLPPASARPKTLWFWMNGNVTRDGITRDLEAMHRVGVGGVLIFDGGSYLPAGPVGYLSPGWRDLMTHAIREGRRLGVEIGMHNAPGWSSSGGPWVTPELSMQQLVWTETTVRGPAAFAAPLAHPQTNEGYYRDAFVLAFPSVAGEQSRYEDALLNVTTGTGEALDPAILSDGRLDTAVTVTPQAYLNFEFAEPVVVHAITANSTVPVETLAATATSATQGHFPTLNVEASLDGVHFTPVCQLTSPGRHGIQAPATQSFPGVRARFFRVRPTQPGELSEVVLHRAPRIEDWAFKANFAYRVGRQLELPAPGDPTAAIDPATVRDLTDKLDADGRLHWDVPPGAWTILRIGHTSTGKLNVSASAAGTGLEIDKMNRAATDFHFDHVVARVLADAGPEAAGLTTISIDSYEAGMQNWTASFPAEFQRLMGYDLRPFLPAMLGRIVGDTARSERFLFDVRTAQAALMADDYYGEMARKSDECGIKLYVEGYGQGMFDELDVSGRAPVPMTEFWNRTPWAPNRTVKMVASAAHVYGKPVVAAEAFTGEEMTSRWLEYPYALKVLGDDMLAQGVNQMVFHRYAHQPHPTAVPGMAMGPWGFFFERTNTWFEQSSGWLTYLARSQFMLRQGTSVADVLYFVGERPPNNPQFAIPVLPAGISYDLISAEALLSRVTVHDGRLVLPEGASYRLLMLPPDLKAMTPGVMAKVRELVEQGAAVLGPKPQFSPTLRGYPESERQMLQSAARLWDEHATGAGRIFASGSVADALGALGVQPDFKYTGDRRDAEVSWAHHRLPDADVYFVSNRQRLPVNLLASFRVAGRVPELWQAETGEMTGAVVYAERDGRTALPLRLESAGSVFVVFRDTGQPAGERWLAAEGAKMLDATIAPKPTAPAVTQTFTMAVWAKPDIDLRLMPTESTTGRLDETGKSYVIPAAEGDVWYGPGHAMAGLAVGRNGAYVVERGRAKSPAVLVERRAVSGWTHFAVVYQKGKPSLYINGHFAREGLASADVVHPGIGSPPPFPETVYHFAALDHVVRASGLPLPPSQGRAFQFEGNLTSPMLFPEALSAEAIARLAAQGLPPPPEPPAIELARREDGRIEGLFWRGGRYALESGRAARVEVAAPVIVSGPWEVAFQDGRGAPATVELPELISWSRHPDPGVKYFSGSAVYRRTLDVPMAFVGRDRRVVLDLGRVEVVADVRVNGRPFGPIWKEPYRIDITDAARAGANALEVRVTNLWPNRLIGDEALPEENAYASTGEQHGILRLPDWYAKGEPKPPGGRITFTTWHFFGREEPLLDSGLLGPVWLLNPVRSGFEQ